MEIKRKRWLKQRTKIRQFKVLERRLAKIIKERQKNEIVLNNSDFKDSKLSFTGYNRLKQECKYIGYSQSIEIIIPKEYADGFTETLENMMANETSHIKKDMKEVNFKSIIFLLIGVLWFTLGNIFEIPNVVKEVTIVATWVFVWAAVEGWFFDNEKLRNRKFMLLHILSAKITIDENKELNK